MKVALNPKDLNDARTITLASTVITDLIGNAKFTPKPPLPALTTLCDAVQAGVDAVTAAWQALTMAVTAKHNALDSLRAGLTDEDTINTLPDDQKEAAIESAGMKAQSAPVRVTSLEAVTNLSVTASDTHGVLDWHCDPRLGVFPRGRIHTRPLVTDNQMAAGPHVHQEQRRNHRDNERRIGKRTCPRRRQPGHHRRARYRRAENCAAIGMWFR